MCSKSHFLTHFVLVPGLALTLLAVAPARQASARVARTSPCHRVAGTDPDKRCVAKRVVVRRDVRRKAKRGQAVGSVAASGSSEVAAERDVNRRLHKRRLVIRHMVRRGPAVVATSLARPAEGPGWVSIESKPGNVRVYINGQWVGLTPLQVKLNEGRHTIEAIRGDGVRQRRIIDIEPGQQRFLVLVS
ncbi:MAG TPA: PEGA domain-containing protein [Polyangia bacterium]|jgi:hypothetical protein|nr:PEGA domain-containing protein [Polyangia bacterium]